MVEATLDGLSRDELLRLMPLVDEAERRVVRDNLETYSLWVAPQEPPARHHKLIMSELQALERSGHGRLMIFAPPGSAKSLTASVKFPSWYLGRHPQHDMICASHTASLAEMFGRRVRNTLADPAFEGTFGVSVSKDNASVGSWSTSHSGRFHAVGVGGSPSGRRADCVVGSTMVETNHGRIRIDNIDICSSPCYILSYDESRKRMAFRRVLAVARRPSFERFRIRTASGNLVEATGNHRFYVHGSGWKECSSISVGDVLLSCVPEASAKVSSRFSEEIPSRRSMHSGLQHSLRDENEQRSPWHGVSKKVQELWSSFASREQESNLFRRVQVGACAETRPENKNRTNKNVRNLLGFFSPKKQRRTIAFLLNEVQKYIPLGSNGRFKQPALAWRRFQRQIQEWGATQVQENEAYSIFAGWKLLCGLHEYAHPACSPYRLGCNEQRADKPRNTLPKMPLGIPRSGERETAEDVVAVVERICGEEVVYDIEVEETHNFFANGVLVHNCLIMDDLVPNREQADSINYHDKCWEWWQSDIRTRLKPKSIAVLIMTRWSPDDIAGRLLDDMKTGGEQWKVISLPMEAEENDMLGREPGELLWPEWFTPDMVRIAKRDARGWSALYQQRPVPDSGDYFKREWIKWYDDRPESMNVYGASDYAVTAEGDYTVHMVAGVDEKDDLYLLDVWRGKEHTDVWVEQLLALVRQWKPVEWAEESGQIEKSVGPFIDKRMKETRTYCYRRQFPSSKDKPTRAQSIRGRLAQGKVYFPRSRPWVADLVSEMMEFPVGKHDDMCDTLGLFGRILDDTRRPVKQKKNEPARWLQNLSINEIIKRAGNKRREAEM